MAPKPKNPYNFPEKNPFKAREVLDTDFDIDKYEGAELYVNLDKVRIAGRYDYRRRIYQNLNIADDKLAVIPYDHKKMILVGHRGSGKTMEMRRLHDYLDHDERYFSVKVELEKEMLPGSMKPEDFYIQMTFGLIRRMKDDGVGFQTKYFNKLIESFLTEKEVVEEITKKYGGEAKGGVNIDTPDWFENLVSFVGLKLDLSLVLASENKTSTFFRKKIKADLLDYIRQLNEGFKGLRKELEARGKGRDLLFVIDGSEKSGPKSINGFFRKTATPSTN